MMTGKVYASMEDIEEQGKDNIEYAEIEGFKADERFRIGSLTAGDMIDWTDANEGEAKRTAGLRLICKSLVGPEPTNTRYANDDKNIAKFRKVNHKVTERIVKEILKLNGMFVKGENAIKNE